MNTFVALKLLSSSPPCRSQLLNAVALALLSLAAAVVAVSAASAVRRVSKFSAAAATRWRF